MRGKIPGAFFRALFIVLLCSFIAVGISARSRRNMTGVSTCGLELALTQDDKGLLETGGVVLRAVGNVSKISLTGGDSGAEVLLGELKLLKPTYLAEVIRTMPYEGNEDLPDKLVDILLELGNNVHIPYISSKGKECSLYRSATIKSNDVLEDGERVVKVDIVMPPVDVMDTKITVKTVEEEGEREYVRFTATNVDPLRFHNIKVVGEKKTLSALLITNDGEKWTMYAICGANAIRLPFLEQSIRISFLNRIKGFCDYVVAKLDE